MKLRIAQIRIVPEKGNLPGNFAKLCAALPAVARRRPDVVITSECFLDGYVSTEKQITRSALRHYAIDPATSEYTRQVARWARTHRAWFIFGCTRREGRRAYNTALIYNRRGRLAGVYDKTHLQWHDRKYAPGRRLPVFASDFGPFGVLICADRRWPETVRTLARKGARIVFNPTYGMCCAFNLAMMRTRSYENELFIVFTHPRQSLITGPTGQIIVNERRRQPAFTVTRVDLAEVAQVRGARHSHLKDLRPDLYR
jgi:predicted amidohydrolase